MRPKIALATVVESRQDFYSKRAHLIEQELAAVDWLRQACDCIEAEPIFSSQQIPAFAEHARNSGAQALVVHIPIWSEPIFTVKLARQIDLPVLLLGNESPETSSIVGLLGAGGALDQVGIEHIRVTNHTDPENRRRVLAFARAAAALGELRGRTLGLFGGRSLGILTAVADPAQWQRLFGVDMEMIDQLEIEQLAETLPHDEIERHSDWLAGRLGSVQFGGSFTAQAFERQVRSYLATRALVERHGFDFIGVKCQPELSDGYVTQCVAHMLSNGNLDADGAKPTLVHACESDADGALSMQILNLVSGGKPAALLDIRWYDRQKNLWTLANCGALPAALFASQEDSSGLSAIAMQEHVFGKAGGGALPAAVPPQQVTLARLCRKKGSYWMAVLAGEVVQSSPGDMQRSTPVFPKAFVRTSAGADFLQVYGSNHIHLVSGDYVLELVEFCRLIGLEVKVWQ